MRLRTVSAKTVRAHLRANHFCVCLNTVQSEKKAAISANIHATVWFQMSVVEQEIQAKSENSPAKT